jgi:hypothetical protein
VNVERQTGRAPATAMTYMIYVDGSKKSFKCTCGCNVFRKRDEAEVFACNACGTEYTSE